MCQLLGLNANTPTDVVFSFTGFSTRARREHKDGFGIAFFEGPRRACLRRRAERAPFAGGRDGAALPDQNRNVILAHIRKGPQAAWRWRNTTRSSAGNGAATGIRAQRRPEGSTRRACMPRSAPVGDTDSERAFCWLMRELAKAHAAVPASRELSARWPSWCPAWAHGSFNFLLSNGRGAVGALLRLHWLVRRAHPFRARSWPTRT